MDRVDYKLKYDKITGIMEEVLKADSWAKCSGNIKIGFRYVNNQDHQTHTQKIDKEKKQWIKD